MALGRFGAIVFDFDGVIAASSDTKTAAFGALFAEHGSEVVRDVQAYHLAHVGISRFSKFDWIYEHILQRPLPPAERAELGQRFAALVVDTIVAGPLVPGARAALQDLAPQLPLFVASGTPHDELRDIVSRMDLATYFRETWGSPTLKPDILRDIATRYRWQPHEMLMIGDGRTDWDAARNVGTEFLACGPDPIWRELGVRRVADLQELPAVVATWT